MFQLFELFTKRTIMKILDFFLDNPSGEFYESEIRKKLGIAKASSIRGLKTLVESQFLAKRTKGRITLYKLDTENVLMKELKKLKSIFLLVSEFKGIIGVEISLYGSGARGEDREGSDLDILVIGKRLDEVMKIIGKAERKIKRRIKPSFFSQLEWSQMSKKDPAFYERVEKDKIRLV